MPKSRKNIKDSHTEDRYFQRLLWLRKYETRIKIIMAGAAGLLFFIGSNLITDLLKLITIGSIFLILAVAYAALIWFDKAIVDVEYKLHGNEKIGDAQVNAAHLWPKLAVSFYFIALWLTILTALALFFCMWCKFDKAKAGQQVKSVACSTVTLSIEPFVEGFDSPLAQASRFCILP